jgi:hypothetical protein
MEKVYPVWVRSGLISLNRHGIQNERYWIKDKQFKSNIYELIKMKKMEFDLLIGSHKYWFAIIVPIKLFERKFKGEERRIKISFFIEIKSFQPEGGI